MKVNKQKISKYHFDPTNNNISKSIEDLNEYIQSGILAIPSYQRDISWNAKKIVDLFNYQLFGKAPISPLSLNELLTKNNDDITPQIHLIDRKPLTEVELNNVKWSVIDGQQRLTSNYMAYTNHKNIQNIVFDVNQAVFKEIKGEINVNQIPVGMLLNEDSETFSDYLKNIPGFDVVNDYAPISDVRSKMLKYEYTLHVAEDMTFDEQLQWFEVLNNAGSRVSGLQLTFSKSKAFDFDIYTDYSKLFQNIINEFGYEELFTPFSTNLSYPVAMLNPAFEKSSNRVHSKNFSPIPSDTKEGPLSKLTGSEMHNLANKTLKGLENALQFIYDHGLFDLVTRMDYILYTTGYFVWFEDEEIDSDKLVNWLKTVDFTNKTQTERREIFSNLLEI